MALLFWKTKVLGVVVGRKRTRFSIFGWWILVLATYVLLVWGAGSGEQQVLRNQRATSRPSLFLTHVILTVDTSQPLPRKSTRTSSYYIVALPKELVQVPPLPQRVQKCWPL